MNLIRNHNEIMAKLVELQFNVSVIMNQLEALQPKSTTEPKKIGLIGGDNLDKVDTATKKSK